MSDGLPQLVMHRPHLDDLPQPIPPTGYQLRCFEDGDEAGWCEVMELAFEWDPGQANFEAMMRSDSAYSPERIRLVLTMQRQVVGTSRNSWAQLCQLIFRQFGGARLVLGGGRFLDQLGACFIQLRRRST